MVILREDLKPRTETMQDAILATVIAVALLVISENATDTFSRPFDDVSCDLRTGAACGRGVRAASEREVVRADTR